MNESSNDARPRKVLAVASGGGTGSSCCGCARRSRRTRLSSRQPIAALPSTCPTIVCTWFATRRAGARSRSCSCLCRCFGLSCVNGPDVVVSTGAAPGYAAIRFAGWIGAKTIWVDSIANVEELSLSGRMAGRIADLWLTQWEHLAGPQGPHFEGSVL